MHNVQQGSVHGRVIYSSPSVTARPALVTKILSLIIVGLMVIQIIKPLGLPGLKKRSDFWKLAIVALAAISMTVLLSHTT